MTTVINKTTGKTENSKRIRSDNPWLLSGNRPFIGDIMLLKVKDRTDIEVYELIEVETGTGSVNLPNPTLSYSKTTGKCTRTWTLGELEPYQPTDEQTTYLSDSYASLVYAIGKGVAITPDMTMRDMQIAVAQAVEAGTIDSTEANTIRSNYKWTYDMMVDSFFGDKELAREEFIKYAGEQQ